MRFPKHVLALRTFDPLIGTSLLRRSAKNLVVFCFTSLILLQTSVRLRPVLMRFAALDSRCFSSPDSVLSLHSRRDVEQSFLDNVRPRLIRFDVVFVIMIAGSSRDGESVHIFVVERN